MCVVKESFGQTNDGQGVDVFVFSNANGVKVKVINYGATIVSVVAPDRAGNLADVVLGFDDIAGYQRTDNPYFGACCGRYANRIAYGKFSLDSKEVKRAGLDYWDKVTLSVWDSFDEFKYNMAYIAMYSPRPGAQSFRWIDDIPKELKRVCITPIGVPKEWPSKKKNDLESFIVKENF